MTRCQTWWGIIKGETENSASAAVACDRVESQRSCSFPQRKKIWQQAVYSIFCHPTYMFVMQNMAGDFRPPRIRLFSAKHENWIKVKYLSALIGVFAVACWRCCCVPAKEQLKGKLQQHLQQRGEKQAYFLQLSIRGARPIPPLSLVILVPIGLASSLLSIIWRLSNFDF